MLVLSMVRSVKRKERERKVCIEYEVSELESKRPCDYVVEVKPFTFKTKKDRGSIQIQLMVTLSNSGCELWGMEDYWTQNDIKMGLSAIVADFNWSPE